MIDLNANKIMIIMIIFHLNAEIMAEEKIMILICKTDNGDIYMAITLIYQNTRVLIEIVMLKSEICL